MKVIPIARRLGFVVVVAGNSVICIIKHALSVVCHYKQGQRRDRLS
jgi:hypothetical protein